MKNEIFNSCRKTEKNNNLKKKNVFLKFNLIIMLKIFFFKFDLIIKLIFFFYIYWKKNINMNAWI
jgi:hypothetical protein